jgi:hypothetical protein
VNWALVMTPAEARSALSRDVCSLARVEMELETLLNTDSLADWADQNLIWDPLSTVRVGAADGDSDLYLFPSYLRWMDQQGRNSRPLSLKVFKAKLIGLLRDTYGLALPAGSGNSGEYKQRGFGSVVPCLRFRQDNDGDRSGVMRHALMARLSETDQSATGMGAERIGNGKTPLGNGWNGCNGSEQIAIKEKNATPSDPTAFSYRDGETPEPVPAVPSVPHKGSCRSAPIPESTRSVPQGLPIDVQDAKTGEWISGWRQIGSGKGSSSVLCLDPQAATRMVEKKRIRPCLQQQAA